MRPTRLALLLIVCASPCLSQEAPDTTHRSGWWISAVTGPGTHRTLGGPALTVQKDEWIASFNLLRGGHESPYLYGETPLPDHEERIATSLELGRMLRREDLVFRAQGGFASYQRLSVSDSVSPEFYKGRLYSAHHTHNKVLDKGFTLSATAGMDFQLSRYVWIGAETHATAGPAGVLAGVGLICAAGVRR